MTERALPLIGEEPELVKASAEDDRYWSVTTILDVINKKALQAWAAIKSSECAVDDIDVWRPMLERNGRDAAIDYIKNARWRAPKGERSDTALGSAVHKALERKVIDGVFPEWARTDLELRPYLHQLNKFLKEFSPAFVASELTVYSPTYRYAGTSDGLFNLGTTRFLYDLKTTKNPLDSRGREKKPFPESALQVTAYRFAELGAVWRARQVETNRRRYYLLNETERALAVPMPEVDHGVVLHVTPDSYGLFPVDCGPAMFDVFLAAVDLARFQYQMADEVVGNPLIPPSALQHATDDPFAGLPS